MSEPRKFYKTIIQIEVLSQDEPITTTNLSDIDYNIDSGDCSGRVQIVSKTLLTPKEAAQALLAQGSYPEFFMLTEDGMDLDDE